MMEHKVEKFEVNRKNIRQTYIKLFNLLRKFKRDKFLSYLSVENDISVVKSEKKFIFISILTTFGKRGILDLKNIKKITLLDADISLNINIQ